MLGESLPHTNPLLAMHGKYNGAIQLYEKLYDWSLGIQKKALDPGHSDVAISLKYGDGS